MISARTLALLAVAAGGYWLWSSGEWRTLAAKAPALAAATDSGAAAADAMPAADAEAMPAPLQVRTWTDDQGVVHFEQAGAAPLGARQHALGSGGTMADYERELEQKEGISIQDVARVRAARERAAEEAAQKERAKTDPSAADNGSGSDLATRQARELMLKYEQGLEKVRAENNH